MTLQDFGHSENIKVVSDISLVVHFKVFYDKFYGSMVLHIYLKAGEYSGKCSLDLNTSHLADLICRVLPL